MAAARTRGVAGRPGRRASARCGARYHRPFEHRGTGRDPRRPRRMHALQTAHAGPHADCFRRRQSDRGRDVRRRSSRGRRRRARRAIRRPGRAAPDEDDRSHGLQARRRLHRECAQVPSAGQPQSRTGRDRDLRAVPVPPARLSRAEGRRSRSAHSRRARCSKPTSRSRGCAAECSTSRRQADSDISSLVPAAQPRLQT